MVNNVLVRQTARYNVLCGGKIRGEILGAWQKQLKSQYSASGYIDGINIKIGVTDTDGVSVELFKTEIISWIEKSDLVSLLKELEILPETGQMLNLDNFRGIPVEVTVENVTINGNIYSNVKRIKKIAVSNDASTEVAPSIEKPLSNISEYKSVSPAEILGVDLDLD